MGGKNCGGGVDLFHNIVSIHNLLLAWKEFCRGKRKKEDVANFEMHLEDNIWQLHGELISGNYKMMPYISFYVCDPKRRNIHKANVRDRIVHQAIFRILYPICDLDFIFDSFSSRTKKGTHLGTRRLFKACRKVTKNWRENAWVLQFDIKKFFDSVDHYILLEQIFLLIHEEKTLLLLQSIISSFEKTKDRGIPLGNVTSQLFANVYMNKFDQFVKHELEVENYFRYCDDVAITHKSREYLLRILEQCENFLKNEMKIFLHPQKTNIRKVRQGIDFLGYVILPNSIILRTHTKHRIEKRLDNVELQSLISYFGVTKHARARELREKIYKRIIFFKNLVTST